MSSSTEIDIDDLGLDDFGLADPDIDVFFEHFTNAAQRLENPSRNHHAPFKFNRYLAGGEGGKAYLFNEVDKDGAILRKVVVKLAVYKEHDKNILNEAKWLSILRNARHIVDIIDADQQNLARPILVTEFLQNGPLDRLHIDSDRVGRGIPNRILWRIFLCCEYCS